MPSSPGLFSRAQLQQVLTHVAVACGAVLLLYWIQRAVKDAPPAETAAEAAILEDTTNPNNTIHSADALQPSETSPDTQAPSPQLPAPATSDRADPAPSPSPAVQASPPPQEDAPLRIETEPAALRVWHPTEMNLLARPSPSERFVRYRWHFGDGSSPKRGAQVSHHFPESVADRHVSLEATRSDGSVLTVSRRLPIERLQIAPLNGEPPSTAPPQKRGLRLVLVGSCERDTLAQIMRQAAGPWKAAALILFGDETLRERARALLSPELRGLPILHLDLGSPPQDAASSPLSVLQDQANRLQHLAAKGADRLMALGPLALLALDSRGEAISEEALKALRIDLQVASAYSATLLLSARPLSPLLDDGPVSPQAYRIYESALRAHVRAYVSGQSQVAYSGRFGGIVALSVGRASLGGCRRLMGSDRCQLPTVTLLDLSERGGTRTTHVLARDLNRMLDDDELPSEVGKYRR